ncbi:hypothetical protein [Parvibaculum sp.]|uniref:hypothetical protein n=1 Tax=Parvibaculum sp. TaxID=2024848 RepID=UPI0025F4BC71|nr:hypothetical protein [Parvibaculum sp.]
MRPDLRLCLVLGAALLLAGCQTPRQYPDARGGDAMASLPPQQKLTPDRLVGVEPDTLERRLGKPDFRRTEPGSEIWQYGGSGCSLFVYFYPDDQGRMGSTYIDARRREGGSADKQNCIDEVASKRSAPMS